MKYNIELINSINGASITIDGADISLYDITFKQKLVKVIINSIVYAFTDELICDLCSNYGIKEPIDEKSIKHVLQIEL